MCKLLYMCLHLHTTIYVSPYTIQVSILLYMCPHTTIPEIMLASSWASRACPRALYYYACVSILLPLYYCLFTTYACVSILLPLYYCLFTTASSTRDRGSASWASRACPQALYYCTRVLKHFTTRHVSALLLYKCLRLLPLYYCLVTTASVLLPTIPAIVEMVRVRDLQELYLLE
jgi:hypothetical protein